MAVNKNAQTRYYVLDKCFSNPMKKYFIEDLIEACNTVLLEIDPNSNGIKRRQVEEDMKYLESAEGWSVALDRIREGKRKYYRYTDSNFSIDKQPLNQAELEQVKSAMQILSRFKGIIGVTRHENVKVQSRLNNASTDQLPEALPNGTSESVCIGDLYRKLKVRSMQTAGMDDILPLISGT